MDSSISETRPDLRYGRMSVRNGQFEHGVVIE